MSKSTMRYYVFQLDKKTLYAATLLILTFAVNGFSQSWQNGWISRYWDACKTHCNWTGNAGGLSNTSGVCSVNNSSLTPNDQSGSACNGGPQYVCWDHSPVIINENLAYAFVATPPGVGNCGDCYEFEFQGTGQHGTGPTHQALSGKKMIVAKTNIGHDVNNNQFDLLVPGGGVGQFNAFSNQLGIQASQLGAQYGGLLTKCTNGDNSVALNTAQSCLRNECNIFTNQILKDGCLFYANWLMAANNPNVRWRSVTCPTELRNWYLNPKQRPTGGGTSSSSVAQSSSSNVATYTVTYNGNATGVTGVPANQTKTHNVNLTLSTATPSRTGYTFAGWNTNSGGTGTNYAAGANYTANANVTLYARWTINTYTVTYNANGGTGAPSVQTKTYNVNLVLSSTTPTRTGYTFAGWNTNSGGTGTNYAAGANYTANANVTLYAQWTANTYTVTYNANGGTGAPSAQIKTHGVNLALSNTTPTRSSYTFTGWNTQENGSGTNYAAGANYTTNANVTLYAQWSSTPSSSSSAATYTVTYSSNSSGVTNMPANQTKTHGIALALSSTIPVRAGHTFTGWNTNSGGTGTNYAAGATYTENANVTLYAQWSTAVSSSSSAGGGGNCQYQASWCNSLYAVATEIPRSSPSSHGDGACFFVTEITKFCANDAMNTLINGNPTTELNYNCWGNRGTLPNKADGGYYVYLPSNQGLGEWGGTAGAAPNCSGGGTSSSSGGGGGGSSSSAAGNVCLQHPVSPVPANPKTACIRVRVGGPEDYHCYICPEHSNCTQDWYWGGAWDRSWPEQISSSLGTPWVYEVSCATGQIVGSSSSTTQSSSSGTTSIHLPQIATANLASVMKNAINLQTTATAVVSIYNMQGRRQERPIMYDPGVYNLSLAHLPRGIYIVRVQFGSETKTLRVPVN